MQKPGMLAPQIRIQPFPNRLLLLAILVCLFSGCALVPDMRHKPQTTNPFPQIKTVAVLPFFNQSEEPTLSGQRVALAYMNQLQAIRGFEVLPQGAVQSKVQEFTRNNPLANGQDFQALARFMGVDAVLVGSVTDYQAYYPPRLSMKVNWYAANPGFHPILPGYGLPWGTKDEKKIPRWVHLEAQRALAAEQLRTQAPEMQSSMASETVGSVASGQSEPILPEDRRAAGLSPGLETHAHGELSQLSGAGEMFVDSGPYGSVSELPDNWPDPRGFIPDAPMPNPPEMIAQHEPIISHISGFNGHDEDFTEQLSDYFYFRDDARFGGWQNYLQRSEDFIRFCCYLHLNETLISRGGQDKSRLILRWPVVRYTR